MATFTVVGLYRDNKQVYVGHHNTDKTGKDAVKQVVKAAKRRMRRNSSDTGAVLSVFRGCQKDIYGENELYGE